jgi:hypothetical protein
MGMYTLWNGIFGWCTVKNGPVFGIDGLGAPGVIHFQLGNVPAPAPPPAPVAPLVAYNSEPGKLGSDGFSMQDLLGDLLGMPVYERRPNEMPGYDGLYSNGIIEINGDKPEPYRLMVGVHEGLHGELGNDELTVRRATLDTLSDAYKIADGSDEQRYNNTPYADGLACRIVGAVYNRIYEICGDEKRARRATREFIGNAMDAADRRLSELTN